MASVSLGLLDDREICHIPQLQFWGPQRVTENSRALLVAVGFPKKVLFALIKSDEVTL